MSTAKQANVFGSNHAVVNQGGGGSAGPVLALGTVAAAIAFAVVLAAAVAAAASLVIIVLGWTASGCLMVWTLTHCGLRVAYFRRTGSLPPARPKTTAALPWPGETPQIEPAAMPMTGRYIPTTDAYLPMDADAASIPGS